MANMLRTNNARADASVYQNDPCFRSCDHLPMKILHTLTKTLALGPVSLCESTRYTPKA